CPGCSWLLAGFLVWALAAWFYMMWLRECRPSVCQRWAEWLLALIAFDIAALLEIALSFCVITSNPVLAALWALFVIVFNVIVYQGLRRNRCLRS
ncbi:MAG: hypothetical protein ABR558_01875, partial [Thioalkalivibrio sp.]